MDDRTWARVDCIVDDSLRQTLRSVGYEPVDAAPRGRKLGAAISLEGSIRGRVVLAADQGAISASCPEPCGDADIELAREWVQELINLIVGRLRAELKACGVKLQLAAPVPMASMVPPLSLRFRPESHHHAAQVGGFAFEFTFEAARDLDLHSPSRPVARPPILLFRDDT